MQTGLNSVANDSIKDSLAAREFRVAEGEGRGGFLPSGNDKSRAARWECVAYAYREQTILGKYRKPFPNA